MTTRQLAVPGAEPSADRPWTDFAQPEAAPDAPARMANGTSEMERLAHEAPELHDVRHEDLARLVHDFRGPLGTIALEAALCADRLAGDANGAQRALTRIGRNVAFLDRLVMDVLDLCSLHAGQFQLRRVPTELGALLEQVIERAVPTRDRGRVLLQLEARVTLALDDLRLERVVANLLHNALAYAPPATVVVVRLRREAAAATVSVIDVGQTLAASDLTRIFDERNGLGAHRAGSGFGLGLYLSKQIVEAHGGAIGVESIRGAGTRFFFELPIRS